MTDSRHHAHTLPSTAMSTNRPTTMERLGTTENIKAGFDHVAQFLAGDAQLRQWS